MGREQFIALTISASVTLSHLQTTLDSILFLSSLSEDEDEVEVEVELDDIDDIDRGGLLASFFPAGPIFKPLNPLFTVTMGALSGMKSGSSSHDNTFSSYDPPPPPPSIIYEPVT